jgi:orotate phosphoribosyltransferase
MKPKREKRAKDYLKLFEETGALLKGHFKLSSGLHSPEYFQCAVVLQYPAIATKLGKDLGVKLKSLRPTVVVSPALGGVIIGHETARALKVRAIFTERREGVMELRRGFSIQKGERAVVIEDVITTGGSTKEVIRVIESLGGRVAGVGCIVDRTSQNPDLPVPLCSLMKMEVVTFPEERLPEWLARIPLTKPGSRPEGAK